MKTKAIILSLAVAATLFVGCTSKNVKTNVTDSSAKTTDTAKTTDKSETTDAVTAASIVDNTDAFETAISSKGKWIIAVTKDITSTKDLVLEGEFKNGKKNDDGTDAIQRKIALYSQDENRNVTANFTLTAPSITIKSPNARIQNGTFKGDIYVETNDFQLVGTKVEGNIFFSNEEAKAGFKMDEKSSVTGKQEVKTDVVTSASVVTDADGFLKAASKDGTWIIATLNDLTIDKEIVLEGDFVNKDAKARKIALYTQDENRKVTASFTLKAPKLTVKSENARIQNGTFVGDIYVEAKGFQLVGAKVDGNIYFANEEAKSTFTIDDKSSVTGKQELQK